MRIPIQKKTLLLTFVSAFSVGLASCSKKNSDSDKASTDSSTIDEEDESQALEPSVNTVVSAATGQLQLAPMVTILPAKESSSASLTGNLREVNFALTEDRTLRLRVNNEAFEAVDEAGSIMCTLAQTKFWEQANAGVYQAMVDESLCSRESGASESGGSSGNQQGAQQSQGSSDMTLVYVEASREENKPLLAKFRVESKGDDEDSSFYHVDLIVVAPPSDIDPAGIFSMKFTQHASDGTTGQYGFIRTKRSANNEFILDIGMTGSDGGGNEHNMKGSAVLSKTEDDNFTGTIISSMSGSGGHGSFSSEYKARFNEDYLNVSGFSAFSDGSFEQENAVEGCYDRNSYKTAIFRYDLTDANGDIVQLNSGFPAEFEKDGKVYHAHASHGGIWIDGGLIPETGDTLYKVDWGNGEEKTRTPYTVFSAPGKLIKLTKATVSLNELKGVDMRYWADGSDYLVQWDGSKLAITAKITYGDKGMEEEEASGDVEIPEWGLGLWINSLNANIQIPYGTTLSGDTTIAYHSETVVSGSDDLPAGELVCFADCPVMTPAASDFERNEQQNNGPRVSNLYKKTSVTWGSETMQVNQSADISAALASYTFDASNQVLKEGTTAYTLPSGLPSSEEELRELDSVWSGALIPKATWQAISDKSIDPYAVQQQVTEYYRWTAGAQNWSQFQGVQDSEGEFVSFDQPLEINFVLKSEDEFDGLSDEKVVDKSYRLSYGGPGQLWGIPWKYNKDVGYEMPLFSLKAGVQIGDYYVYPLEGEQRMAQTDAANCAELSLSDLPNLPEVAEDIVDVGELGNIDSPTRYIAGVATGS